MVESYVILEALTHTPVLVPGLGNTLLEHCITCSLVYIRVYPQPSELFSCPPLRQSSHGSVDYSGAEIRKITAATQSGAKQTPSWYGSAYMCGPSVSKTSERGPENRNVSPHFCLRMPELCPTACEKERNSAAKVSADTARVGKVKLHTQKRRVLMFLLRGTVHY